MLIKPEREMCFKYLDYMRTKLVTIPKPVDRMINECHHREQLHHIKSVLVICDVEIHLSVDVGERGYLVVIVSRAREATYDDKPDFFTLQSHDRSILYEFFKDSFDKIFNKRIIKNGIH